MFNVGRREILIGWAMENLLNSFSDKSRPIFIWEDINLQGVPKNVQKGAKLTNNGHFLGHLVY